MSNRTLAWLLAAAAGVLAFGLLMAFAETKSVRNSLANVMPSCVARSDQCESIAQEHVLAEPENTITNIAYLVAGVAVIVRSLRSGMDRRRAAPLVVGLAFVFLAFCSADYHGTLNGIQDAGTLSACNPDQGQGPQKLDIIGVYLVLLSMVCYALDRLLRKTFVFGPLSVLVIALSLVVALAAWLVPGVLSTQDADIDQAKNHWIRTGLGIWLVCGVDAAVIAALIYWAARAWVVSLVFTAMAIANALFAACMKIKFGFDSTLVFAVLVGPLLALLAMQVILPAAPGDRAWKFSFAELGLTLSAFTIGLVMRTTDGPGHPLCSPGAWIQAHALWHVMSAFALLLTFDLIEKACGEAASGGTDNGPALLPAHGSVETWLSLGTWGGLVFKCGMSLIAIVFALVVLIALPLGASTLSIAVPLATAAWLWIVGGLGPIAASTRDSSLR